MRFLAMVRGEDFEGRFDGAHVRVGFYANRGVEAASAAKIDRAALFESIAKDLESNGVMATPQSRLSIRRLSIRSDADTRQFSGFSFYKQDSWLKRVFWKLFI